MELFLEKKRFKLVVLCQIDDEQKQFRDKKFLGYLAQNALSRKPFLILTLFCHPSFKFHVIKFSSSIRRFKLNISNLWTIDNLFLSGFSLVTSVFHHHLQLYVY